MARGERPIVVRLRLQFGQAQARLRGKSGVQLRIDGKRASILGDEAASFEHSLGRFCFSQFDPQRDAQGVDLLSSRSRIVKERFVIFKDEGSFVVPERDCDALPSGRVMWSSTETTSDGNND